MGIVDFASVFQDSLVMNLFRLIQKLKPSKKKDPGMFIHMQIINY